jgi:periplasmic protein TonB
LIEGTVSRAYNFALEGYLGVFALQSEQDTSGASPDAGSSLGIAERRAHPRQRVTSIAYIELGDSNGGIVLNVSEEGLALTAVGVLELESLPRIRIQLPRSRDWTEISGQIAWISESKKEAGIRFENLTEEVRDRIKNWIASEVAASGSPHGNYQAPQKATPPLETRIPEAPLQATSQLHEAAPSIPASSTPDATAAEPAVELGSSTPAAPSHDAMDASSQATAHETDESSSQARTPEVSQQPSERRLHARRRVKSLSYIELGQTNGGIVINMSEEGLQVQAAVALTGDRISRMRFQLPQSGDRIEVGGKVAWTSESQKEAGIQFIDLPEEERAKLREWVASEPPSIGIHAVKPQAREKNSPPPEWPKLQHPGRVLREPGAFDRPALRTQPLVAASSSLAFSPLPQRSSKPEPALPAPPLLILKPAGEAQTEPRRKTAFAWMNLGTQRRTWEIIAGAIAIVSAISFSIGWIVAWRSARNSAVTFSETKDEVAPSEAVKSVASPPANGIAPTPSNEAKKAPAPGHEAVIAPAPATKDSGRANSTTNSARAENKAPQNPAASAIQSRVPPAAVNVAKPSAKINAAPSPPIAVMRPVLRPPVSPIPTPVQPPIANAPTAAAVAKPNPEPAPAKKEPEIPAPAGAVSISLPAFPSIRVPTELKAQSSKLGTSLRFGQLVAQVTPLYPEEIRRQHVEGIVKVHVIVGKDGSVRSATLVSGPAMLEPSAINAILQWKFAPTLFGGQAIEVEEVITVLFRLKS